MWDVNMQVGEGGGKGCVVIGWSHELWNKESGEWRGHLWKIEFKVKLIRLSNGEEGGDGVNV